MILLTSLAAGLAVGFIGSCVTGRRLHAPHIRWVLLAAFAFLPQLLAFRLEWTSRQVSSDLAAAALVFSQALLLIFIVRNHRAHGFVLLGVGAALNFVVIVANGGFMPISPDTMAWVAPERPDLWQTGHIPTSRSIVLLPEEMRFAWLSDRFHLPAWAPQRLAYSIGDVFIAAGAFWFCWSLWQAAPSTPQSQILPRPIIQSKGASNST